MRIEVRDIPRNGRQLSFDGPSVQALAGEALDAELTVATASLVVRRKGDQVVVEGTVRAEGTRPCDRCGKETPLAVAGDERLVFVPRDRLAPTSGEVELAEEDLDVGFYDGSALETDDLLSELFALAAPFRVTCARLDCGAASDASAGEEGEEGFGQGRSNPFAALKDHF